MASLIKLSLFERFVEMIYRLTEPYAEFSEPEKRLPARLLAAILLALAVFMAVIVFVELLISPRDWFVIFQAGLSCGLLLGLYVLSRSQYYRRAAAILITLTLTVPTLIVLGDPTAFTAIGLSYLTIGVLISSLVFSTGFTALLAVVVSLMTVGVSSYYQALLGMDMSIIYLNVILVGLITMIGLVRDKHQAIIAQQAAALVDERNLLRTVIETIPASIYVKDVDSRFLLANHMVANAFNTPVEDIIGKTDADFFDADFSVKNRKAERDLLQSGVSIIEHEEYLHLPNGKALWSMITKVPLHDQQGRVIGLVGINRSIDKRKRAEMALEAERNLLRTVLESLPEAIYVKDRESQFTLVNQRVLDWHNLTSADEIIGKTDREVLGEHYWSRTRSGELTVIETGTPAVKEYQGYSPGLQEPRWLSTTKVPLYDSDQQIVGIVGINRDITERKIAEQALTEERNLLRTLIDAMPDAIYIKDTESRFLLVNKLVIQNNRLTDEADLLGKTDKDIIGENAWNLTRPEDLMIIREGQRIINKERTWLGPDGERLWWLITKVPIYNSQGQCIGLVGIDRNIKERKRMELALMEERNLLRSIIENVPDQIYVKDRESRFLVVNGPLLQRHDLHTTDEIVGKTDLDLLQIAPGLAEQYLEQERRIFEAGERVINFEVAYVKDGQQRWNIINKVPLRDSQGEIIGLVGINRDITERKRIEDALVAERNLLHSIIENIPDPIYVKDRESRFLLVNRIILEGMGLNSLEDIVGKTDFDFIDAEEAQPYYDAEQELMRTGRSVINQEASGKDFERSEDSFLITKVPLRDPNGEIVGIVGINRNINERKRMENDLAKERALLRTLIETIPDSIYVKDTQGRFVLANQTCWQNEKLGSMEEIIGKTDFDFYAPPLAQAFWEEDLKVIETGQPVINRIARNVEPNGRLSFVVITKVPLYDDNGERVGLIGINRDISEHVQTEMQMSYQSTLIENITGAVVSTDTNFNILSWNYGAEALYGWKAEEVIGRYIDDIIPSLESDESRKARRSVFAEQGHWRGEVVHPRKDGTTVDIFSSVSRVYDRSGVLIGMIGINHDITEQKLAEKQRVELAIERERMEILRRFIGDMSHDLRNPLATIKVSLYLLRRLMDNPERREYHIDTLEAQIERLEHMVNDLLSMANLDSAASEFHFEDVDVTQLVYEVVTHQEPLAARREQKLWFEAEESLPLVYCDYNMLVRAVTNLIANALNYTPTGGEVSVRVYRQDHQIGIRIRDNGIGIEPADLPHIFERFYRADKARSADTGGTGLGLSITQRIIEAHEGEILVESQPGSGSTFTILLPVAAARQIS